MWYGNLRGLIKYFSMLLIIGIHTKLVKALLVKIVDRASVDEKMRRYTLLIWSMKKNSK